MERRETISDGNAGRGECKGGRDSASEFGIVLLFRSP